MKSTTVATAIIGLIYPHVIKGIGCHEGMVYYRADNSVIEGYSFTKVVEGSGYKACVRITNQCDGQYPSSNCRNFPTAVRIVEYLALLFKCDSGPSESSVECSEQNLSYIPPAYFFHRDK